MATPFLEIAAFKAEYQGTLNAGQTTTATRLLEVISDYIRDRKPDANMLAAQQVVFEAVSDALSYGRYAGLLELETETSKRRERIKFDEAAKVLDDLLTDKHKELLGISLGRTVAPRGRFKKCDY